MHVPGGAKKERNSWNHMYTCPQSAKKNKKEKKKKEKLSETRYACPEGAKHMVGSKTCG
jgi:hypothetical protein